MSLSLRIRCTTLLHYASVQPTKTLCSYAKSRRCSFSATLLSSVFLRCLRNAVMAGWCTRDDIFWPQLPKEEITHFFENETKWFEDAVDEFAELVWQSDDPSLEGMHQRMMLIGRWVNRVGKVPMPKHAVEKLASALLRLVYLSKEEEEALATWCGELHNVIKSFDVKKEKDIEFNPDPDFFLNLVRGMKGWYKVNFRNEITASATTKVVVHLIKAIKWRFPDPFAEKLLEESDRQLQNLHPFSEEFSEQLAILCLFLPPNYNANPSVPCFRIVKYLAQDIGGMRRNEFFREEVVKLVGRVAKRDREGNFGLSECFANVLQLALWSIDVPLSAPSTMRGMNRREIKPTAVTSFSQFDNVQEVEAIAKALIYLIDNDEVRVSELESLLDICEHFCHPRSEGEWAAELSTFMECFAIYLIKRVEAERINEKRHNGVQLSDATLERICGSLMKIVRVAHHCRSSDMRLTALNTAPRLAYLCPHLMLPEVCSTFERSLLEETASQELSNAIWLLAYCARPLLLSEMKGVKLSGNATPSEFVAVAMKELLPGIDLNDSKKASGSVCFFCTVLSCERECGDGDGVIPIDWSHWVEGLLDHIFTLFHANEESAMSSNAEGRQRETSTGLGNSLFFKPMMENLVALLDKDLRTFVLHRISSFVLNTSGTFFKEAQHLVCPFFKQYPWEARTALLHPVLGSLTEHLNSSGQGIIGWALEKKLMWMITLLANVCRSAKQVVASEMDNLMEVVNKVSSMLDDVWSRRIESCLSDLISSLAQGCGERTFKNKHQESQSLGETSVTKWEGPGETLEPEWVDESDDMAAFWEKYIDLIFSALHSSYQVLVESQGSPFDNLLEKKLRKFVLIAAGGIVGMKRCMPSWSGTFHTKSLPIQRTLRDQLASKVAGIINLARGIVSDSTIMEKMCVMANQLLVSGGKPPSDFSEAITEQWYPLVEPLTEPAIAALTFPLGIPPRKRRPRWLHCERVQLLYNMFLVTNRLRSATTLGTKEKYFTIPEAPQKESFHGLLDEIKQLSLHQYGNVRCSAVDGIRGIMNTHWELQRDTFEWSARLISQDKEEDTLSGALGVICAGASKLRAKFAADHTFKILCEILNSAHRDTLREQGMIKAIFAHTIFFQSSPRRQSVLEQPKLFKDVVDKAMHLTGPSSHWRYSMFAKINLLILSSISSGVGGEDLSNQALLKKFLYSLQYGANTERMLAVEAVSILAKRIRLDGESADVGTVLSFESIFRALAEEHELKGKDEDVEVFANRLRSGPFAYSRWVTKYGLSSTSFKTVHARMMKRLFQLDGVDVGECVRVLTELCTEDVYSRIASIEIICGMLWAGKGEEHFEKLKSVVNRLSDDPKTEQKGDIQSAFRTIVQDKVLKGCLKGERILSFIFSTLLEAIDADVSSPALTVRVLTCHSTVCALSTSSKGADFKISLANKLPTLLGHQSRQVREASARCAAVLMASALERPDITGKEVELKVKELKSHILHEGEQAANLLHSLGPLDSLNDQHGKQRGETATRQVHACFEFVCEALSWEDGKHIHHELVEVFPPLARLINSPRVDVQNICRTFIATTRDEFMETVFLESKFQPVLEKMARAEPQWILRGSVTSLVHVVAGNHSFLLRKTGLERAMQTVKERVFDKQVEVRQVGSLCLPPFFRGRGLRFFFADIRREALALARERGNTALSSTQGARAGEDRISKVHGCVLLLCACIASFPYDCPVRLLRCWHGF